MAKDVLYIGIDLGTFRSVMVSSDNHEEEELTVIGTPKDPIARNFLKRDVLFGNEALKNRLALNLFRPLELGVIKDTPEDREYIAHFITHLIGLSDPEDYDRVVAVIGAPAEASHVDKTSIFDAAAGSVNAAMIISEPFAVAYALDMITHTLVIDIGAGTTDLCRVYGTIPGPGDQMHTGYAGDYVELMWKMLQQKEADDYVIATGESHSVRDFVNAAAKALDMKISWEGKGLKEVAKDEKGNVILRINEKYYRPSEVDYLLGDSTKAKEKLGWVPKVSFEELVKMMAEADYEKYKKLK